MSKKTQAERIAQLETQVEALLARIAMLEARPPIMLIPPSLPQPVFPPPNPPHWPTILCGTQHILGCNCPQAVC